MLSVRDYHFQPKSSKSRYNLNEINNMIFGHQVGLAVLCTMDMGTVFIWILFDVVCAFGIELLSLI